MPFYHQVTGSQYNNYQPYLNAGENKPGFAYLTPYYLKQQIKNVEDLVDFVIIEMHAGSEYSYSPAQIMIIMNLRKTLKTYDTTQQAQVVT